MALAGGQQSTRSEGIYLGESRRVEPEVSKGCTARRLGEEGHHKDGRRATQGRTWNPVTPLPFQGKVFKELSQNSNKT